MNTLSVPEPFDVEPDSETVYPEWHAPVITRIDIKRTMLGGGSKDDGETFGTKSG